MANIRIVHPHSLPPEQARAAAQQVADRIASDYAMQCAWRGDTLHFERGGVKGALALEARQVQVEISLGLMMGAFAGPIEQKIRANIDRVFA
jgi:putative polyhydroxyalkanoate system protein